MPVFFGRPLLFIFLWEVNFKIVVSAVKKNTAEIPPVMLFIAVVEQFNIFFIGFPDESTAIINLILGKMCIRDRPEGILACGIKRLCDDYVPGGK